MTGRVLDNDKFNEACLPIHVACQVELKEINSLFYLSHQLVDNMPQKAVCAALFVLVGEEEERRVHTPHTHPLLLSLSHSFTHPLSLFLSLSLTHTHTHLLQRKPNGPKRR